MRVLRLDSDRIWVEGADSAIDLVGGHLQVYKVGREVTVEPVEGPSVLSLIGPRASELLGAVPLGSEHDHATQRLAGSEVRRVSTIWGADLLLDASEVEPVREELVSAGAEIVDQRAVDILRVEAGRPALGAEISEGTLPQEAGITERAVSFSKGCYIGQETVARLHYRGKPNRHLRRLVADRPMSNGDEVRLGERVLGAIGTAVISPADGPLALAILRREAEPGAKVIVGDGIEAKVEEIGG
jgi:tRNA-modifying protein YgfZ